MIDQFQHGYALVVGIGADLPATVKDASGVAEIFCDRTRCAYPERQVELLTGEEAQRDAILSGLDLLASQAQADKDATIIVFFSGHGIEAPEYYLLPYGYNLADLPGSAISSQEFTRKLNAINARKLIVLLDCCHAAGMADVKGVPIAKSPLPPTMISELSVGSGRVVIASSHKDEYSFVGDPYSVFTGSLLESLAGYGAFERDGYARILDIAMWLGRSVPEKTRDQQHPIVKVSDLSDNFSIAFYSGGEKDPRPFDWAHRSPQTNLALNSSQVDTWRRMLSNYRENLMLIEERMSEHVEYNEIPLQTVKQRRHTEGLIKDLEKKLNGNGN